MTQHECHHEADLGEMAADIRHIKESVDSINNSLNNGLKTQVALNKQSTGRLWWFVGFISTGIVGGAIGLLYYIAQQNVT